MTITARWWRLGKIVPEAQRKDLPHEKIELLAPHRYALPGKKYIGDVERNEDESQGYGDIDFSLKCHIAIPR